MSEPREWWFIETSKYNWSVFAYDPAWIDDKYKIHVVEASALDDLRTENKRLRDALQFYGSYDNWFSGGLEGDGSGYSADHGSKARAALEKP